MQVPHYELIRGGKMGRLTDHYTFKTPITGHEAQIDTARLKCKLFPSGLLFCGMDTEWDFGSGAVDTPAMVIASLAHDMGCELTNRRLLPWSCRRQFDGYFRQILTECGNGPWRYARWAGVSMYSQFIARWRDKK